MVWKLWKCKEKGKKKGQLCKVLILAQEGFITMPSSFLTKRFILKNSFVIPHKVLLHCIDGIASTDFNYEEPDLRSGFALVETGSPAYPRL